MLSLRLSRPPCRRPPHRVVVIQTSSSDSVSDGGVVRSPCQSLFQSRTLGEGPQEASSEARFGEGATVGEHGGRIAVVRLNEEKHGAEVLPVSSQAGHSFPGKLLTNIRATSRARRRSRSVADTKGSAPSPIQATFLFSRTYPTWSGRPLLLRSTLRT